MAPSSLDIPLVVGPLGQGQQGLSTGPGCNRLLEVDASLAHLLGPMIEAAECQVHLMAGRLMSRPVLHLSQLDVHVVIAVCINRQETVVPLLPQRGLDESARLAWMGCREKGTRDHHGHTRLMQVLAREQVGHALDGGGIGSRLFQKPTNGHLSIVIGHQVRNRMTIFQKLGDANEVLPLLTQLIGPGEEPHGVNLSLLTLDQPV